MRIVTSRLSPTIEDYEILDTTFSDVDKYPFLKELEICSLLMTQGGKKGGNTRGRFCRGEYLTPEGNGKVACIVGGVRTTYSTILCRLWVSTSLL